MHIIQPHINILTTISLQKLPNITAYVGPNNIKIPKFCAKIQTYMIDSLLCDAPSSLRGLMFLQVRSVGLKTRFRSLT